MLKAYVISIYGIHNIWRQVMLCDCYSVRTSVKTLDYKIKLKRIDSYFLYNGKTASCSYFWTCKCADCSSVQFCSMPLEWCTLTVPHSLYNVRLCRIRHNSANHSLWCRCYSDNKMSRSDWSASILVGIRTNAAWRTYKRLLYTELHWYYTMAPKSRQPLLRSRPQTLVPAVRLLQNKDYWWL